MTTPRSFRLRVFWGALFGALGMLLLGHILMLGLIRYTRVFHFNPGTMTEFIPIALVLIAIGAWHVRKGLSPFDLLRARLAAMREGKGDRIEGEYPGEVQPLVNDLNALLDHRERTLKRAQTQAGDLAHGLKTPLAVLSHEAERARGAGQPELAETISQQVERMQKQVEYHLAHARAAASGATPGARCAVAASADGLIGTLSHIYADRGITIDSTIPPQHVAQAQREDLDEMLGNLLDNACKWANSRIVLASSDAGAEIVITVDDDGPGLNPDQRERVLRRGVRADEAAPGSGLGLAIVRDIAELHGGSIVLDKSPMGGVRAQLRLQRSL